MVESHNQDTDTKIPRSLTPLLGKRLEVLPQTILGLRSLGESFYLYLHGLDAISQHFTNTLDRYLEYNTVTHLVLDVCLTTYPQGIELLEVVIVPQLRAFSYGVEMDRQRGTADYAELDRMFYCL